MSTNGKAYNELSEQEKADFREQYGNHPLADYIDWQAYYDNPNGNTLDFVNYISKYKDENEQDVFVLEKLVENNLDYALVFVCGENAFYKIPSAEIDDF